MIFVISGLFIIHNNNLNIYDKESSKQFVNLYSNWVNKFYVNVQTVTGNAVKMDWLPE